MCHKTIVRSRRPLQCSLLAKAIHGSGSGAHCRSTAIPFHDRPSAVGRLNKTGIQRTECSGHGSQAFCPKPATCLYHAVALGELRRVGLHQGCAERRGAQRREQACAQQGTKIPLFQEPSRCHKLCSITCLVVKSLNPEFVEHRIMLCLSYASSCICFW